MRINAGAYTLQRSTRPALVSSASQAFGDEGVLFQGCLSAHMKPCSERSFIRAETSHLRPKTQAASEARYTRNQEQLERNPVESMPLMHALMRLGRGYVLMAEETRHIVAALESPSRPDGISLAFAAPNWLVSQLEQRSDERRMRFAVLSPDDGQDAMLQVIVQNGSVQLRLMLHMNVEAVQLLLRDARQRGQLNVLVSIEHSTRVGFLSLPFPSDLDASLWQTLDSLQDEAGDLNRALKIAALHTLPDSVPSFVEGKEVTDVVAVLVAGDVDDLDDEDVASLVQDPSQMTLPLLH